MLSFLKVDLKNVLCILTNILIKYVICIRGRVLTEKLFEEEKNVKEFVTNTETCC